MSQNVILNFRRGHAVKVAVARESGIIVRTCNLSGACTVQVYTCGYVAIDIWYSRLTKSG
jgi:S-adenosylmethionine/arginine decarboxylase-like enzyme